MKPVMMLPKVVILLACLYVVRAGVFTVNAYEDENNEIDVPSEDSVDNTVRSCVNARCNSVCRALGFARGVCISSTVCRCSGRLAKSNDKDVSLDNVNQEIENAYDDAETLDRSVRRCVNSQCNSVCRALGFARGVCISSTVCRCSGRRARDASLDEVNQEINEDPEEAVVRTGRSCGAAECNAFCRKLGYARGVCIGTYCQCRTRAASDVLQPEIENPSDGDDDARSAFLNAISPEIDNPTDEVTLESSTRKCVNSQCRSACRRRGFTRGVCVGINVCRCSGRVRATEEAATLDDVSQEENVYDGGETLDRSVRSCVNSQCNSVCRALGFARGVCISSTVCRCSGRLAKTSEDATYIEEVNQETENFYDGADTLDRSVRSCVNSQCNSVCRALGFARGVCISSTVCRCSGRLAKANVEDASFDNVNQETEYFNDGAAADTLDRSVRRCVNSQCNSVCRALGFARGVCISSTVCRCSGRRSQEVSPEANTIQEQTPEINDVAVNKASCNLRWCEQTCRRMGFPGGVCVNGRCKCDILRSSPMADSDVSAAADPENPAFEEESNDIPQN